MKRNLVFTSLFCIMLFLMIGCGSSRVGIKPIDDDATEVEESMDLEVNNTNEGGGVAAWGIGISKRRDIARDKATIDAQGNIAESFKVEVNRLRKKFVEEVGTDNTEIIEHFSDVIESFTSKTLKGLVKASP